MRERSAFIDMCLSEGAYCKPLMRKDSFGSLEHCENRINPEYP